MFVLAHLSDPHLAPLPKPHLHELAGKRLGGLLNWHRNRRSFHLRAVLDRIVADLKSRAPDHIAVTGDLVNLSLAAEFAPARAWLDRLGLPHDVTLVPGNHDAYARRTAHHPQLHWGDYMRGDDVSPSEQPIFPFLRRRGPVALIGLTTAVPAPPFRATGRLGAQQLARFAEVAARLGHEGVFRVVLIHHPPVTSPERHHERLIDGAAFLDVLKTHGAELVIHGHDHVRSLSFVEGPRQRIPVAGVPSASEAPPPGKHDAAGYNLYRIGGSAGAWRTEVISRGIAPDAANVIEIKRTVLSGS